MNLEIPSSIEEEHAGLHALLTQATREPGAVGETARELAALLHPHFEREEAFALPPLALLPALARGEVTPQMAPAVGMARQLRQEMSSMLADHGRIVEALDRLREAARNAGIAAYEDFCDALIEHARNEEEVLYPAAILVGEHLERHLAPELTRAAASGQENAPATPSSAAPATAPPATPATPTGSAPAAS